MVTIYDFLEVDENASKEEIERAYHNLVLEYKVNPVLSEKENKENELILNKLKIAYEILMDDEKREKYNKDLAKKRAENLIKNVETTSTKKVKPEISNNELKTDDDNNIDSVDEINSSKIEEDEVELSKKEKKNVQKAAKLEFERNLKKAQKVEEEYNQAYNKAYNDYLKKMGYKTKEPLTLKKIKNTVIIITVTIVVCFIAWNIPPINKLLKNIYEENFIIKSVVDLFRIFFNAIFSIFK